MKPFFISDVRHTESIKIGIGDLWRQTCGEGRVIVSLTGSGDNFFCVSKRPIVFVC